MDYKLSQVLETSISPGTEDHPGPTWETGIVLIEPLVKSIG